MAWGLFPNACRRCHQLWKHLSPSPPAKPLKILQYPFYTGSILQSHLLLDFSADPALEGSQEMLATVTGIFLGDCLKEHLLGNLSHKVTAWRMLHLRTEDWL